MDARRLPGDVAVSCKSAFIIRRPRSKKGGKVKIIPFYDPLEVTGVPGNMQERPAQFISLLPEKTDGFLFLAIRCRESDVIRSGNIPGRRDTIVFKAVCNSGRRPHRYRRSR